MVMKENDNGGGRAVRDFFNKLPEGCIAHIISLTTPQDVCRLSLVGSTFRSAADSHAVWHAFLPPDYKDLIARGGDHQLPFPHTTTKDLFFHLADNPLIIDTGTKSFSLEKRSGRKCYMLSARNLTIVWGGTPMYWTFTSLPESRFPEVAELITVCWLEIRGKLSTKLLSPNTLYGAYLVFKLRSDAYGMDNPGEVSCWISGESKTTQTVFLDHNPGRFGILGQEEEEEDQVQEDRIRGNYQQQPQPPKVRRDGWMEIKMGEYLMRGLDGEDCDDGDLKMSFMLLKGNWKSGLIVEGIEIRPV